MQEKARKVIFIGLVFLDQISKILALKFGFGILNQRSLWGWLPSLLTNSTFLVLNTGFLMLLFGFRRNIYVMLILTGGAANLIDRIFRGGVVDFIRLPFIPSFNLADMMICLGLTLFLVDFAKTKTLS